MAMAKPNYPKLTTDVQAREAEVLEFWKARRTFEKSLEKTKGGPRYVFYEGPPTANGKPHFGHLMPRVYKDLFPRYKTMRGFHCLRKGGWDTHGLPVELEVEKALGLNSKPDIERYGVERFIQKCKESVWAYKADWERMIERMGFWIDLENAYITYTDEYIESVWWALKRIWEQGLLYKSYKVLPYCPRCGTPLSSHEVALGYKDVTEPAITVKFKLEGRPHEHETENEYVLAWTTTPWTLPGNVALAVGPDIEYAKVRQGDEVYYLAKERLDAVLEGDYELLGTLKGSEMEGWAYEPPFPYLRELLKAEGEGEEPKAWFVTAQTDGMVSTEEGTGVVHTAVMYGEEDYQLGERLGLPKRHTVDLSGRFIPEVKPYAGLFVKEADRRIIDDLKARGLLYKVENYTHAYPFCWRCDTPLLYYALESWFIKTTAKQREIIENNKHVHWHPEHIRDGRYGNFLETMKDWALSRDRYWGTPLPVWICEGCKRELCVGSRQELIEHALDKALAERVEFHKPYIDEVRLRCPDCGGTMRRVPQVIDCWFDSGMMHTAQYHAPFENQKLWREQFPADFICEGLDQTRGWFYTLMVTSTLLYPDEPYPHPYRHVLVTGLGLDAQGRKMSKSRGNVLDPMEFVDEYGADTLRWYLYSGSAPWRDRPLSKEGAARVRYGFLSTVENVYNFFALYASIDGFDYNEHALALEERPALDRWIVSRFERTARTVTQALDAYDVVKATQAIELFVDDLSNWYVRVSRPRFWGSEFSRDKRAGYATLYEMLLGLSKLLAPFTPFLAEAIYRGLGAPEEESVHLCAYPEGDPARLDDELERQMAVARQIVSLGRAARKNCGLKVRQPLRAITVQHATVRALPEELVELIKGELNVKALRFTDEDLRARHVRPSVEPRMNAIGPKFGPLAPRVRAAVEAADPRALAEALERQGKVELTVDGRRVELTPEELRVSYGTEPKAPVAFDDECVVVLDTALTPELRAEGHVRELIHQVQQLRKKAGYEVTDRIELYVQADPELRRAIEQLRERVQSETLAVELALTEPPKDRVDHAEELSVNGLRAKVGLKRKSRPKPKLKGEGEGEGKAPS